LADFPDFNTAGPGHDGHQTRILKTKAREKRMTIRHEQDNAAEKKILHYESGKIYFSRESERKLFFVLTMIMLAAGILTRMGLF